MKLNLSAIVKLPPKNQNARVAMIAFSLAHSVLKPAFGDLDFFKARTSSK
jgi:hypothetical protein